MPLGKQVPDKTLQRSVDQKLTRAAVGLSNKVTAVARNGDVTITGSIEHEYQRRTIVRSIGNLAGVRRVVDNLRLEPKKKTWT